MRRPAGLQTLVNPDVLLYIEHLESVHKSHQRYIGDGFLLEGGKFRSPTVEQDGWAAEQMARHADAEMTRVHIYVSRAED